jgi:hypothetical protein
MSLTDAEKNQTGFAQLFQAVNKCFGAKDELLQIVINGQILNREEILRQIDLGDI